MNKSTLPALGMFLLASLASANTARANDPSAIINLFGALVEQAERNRQQNAQEQKVVRQIQKALATIGFYDGAIDGKFGPKTASALADYQREFRRPQGRLNADELHNLTVIAEMGFRNYDDLSYAIDNEFKDYEELVDARRGGFTNGTQYRRAKELGFGTEAELQDFTRSGASSKSEYERLKAQDSIEVLTERCIQETLVNSLEQAISVCNRVLARDPTNSSAMLALQKVDLARALADKEKAIADLEIARTEAERARTQAEQDRLAAESLAQDELLKSEMVKGGFPDRDSFMSAKSLNITNYFDYQSYLKKMEQEEADQREKADIDRAVEEEKSRKLIEDNRRRTTFLTRLRAFQGKCFDGKRATGLSRLFGRDESNRLELDALSYQCVKRVDDTGLTFFIRDAKVANIMRQSTKSRNWQLIEVEDNGFRTPFSQFNKVSSVIDELRAYGYDPLKETCAQTDGSETIEKNSSSVTNGRFSKSFGITCVTNDAIIEYSYMLDADPFTVYKNNSEYLGPCLSYENKLLNERYCETLFTVVRTEFKVQQ